jgi:hypothetical protein
MNYYVLTLEQFENADKDQVSYVHYNNEGTKVIVSTTEVIAERYRKFKSKNTCSDYSFSNSADWVGDNTGIEEWEIEDIIYLQNL